METCLDCGVVLRKEPKPKTGYRTMQIPSAECDHAQVTWKGSNGYVWKWTCEPCGQRETVRMQVCPGKPAPRGFALRDGAVAKRTGIKLDPYVIWALMGP